MCLLQIGELSGRLSSDFKDTTRNRVTWGALKAMRNMFAHEYISMDKPTIWDTAANDTPALLEFCQEIIAQNPDEFELFDPLPEEDDPDENKSSGMTMQ